MELYSNLKEGEKGAWLSIWTYITLSAVKLIIGYIGSSEALKADGLNNTTDIIASIAILVGLRIAQKPPDADHQYGHMRAETVASLCRRVHHGVRRFSNITERWKINYQSGQCIPFYSNCGCCDIKCSRDVFGLPI